MNKLSYKSKKLALDFLLMVTLFIPFHFMMAMVVLAILISGQTRIIFKQQRSGINGIVFSIFKFRTMTPEACPQPTKLGRWLRCLSLDELPQIWNVIRGEMSFVGPRPLLEEYRNLYNDDQMKRLLIKPGITGWAQVNGRQSLSWDEKFELDIEYINNKSLKFDFYILVETICQIFKPKDIHITNTCRFTRN